MPDSQQSPAINMQSPECTIEEVVTTEELAQRPTRAPEYASENAALLELAEGLAEAPTQTLAKLVDAALRLTGAHSAGISLAEGDGPEAIFRWRATAGEFDRYIGGTMPRHFSPCGTVLERGASLLMKDPVRAYPYIAQLHRPVREVLLVPFSRGNKLIGTVWAVAHSAEKVFDLEDLRLVRSLAQFASLATRALDDRDVLEHTSRALTLERIRVESALEAGAIGTWTWDLHTNTVVADRNLAALFGIDMREGAGAPLSRYLATIHADDRPHVEAALDEVVRNGKPYQVEYRLARHDGSIRWIHTRGGARHDATGAVIEMTGVALDISERKERELREHEESRRKTEFLATLAHELRNPLAPIRNGLEVLKRAPDRAPAVISMMERQVSHLVRLIDDLLDISRIASNKLTLRRERVAVAVVVGEAVEATQPHFAAKNHSVSVTAPPHLAIDADPVRIAQVLTNLLTNAAKYTPSGGRISVEAGTRGKSVYIAVKDNGAGVAPEHIERIFELFGQVNDQDAEGGLGIGLALSRRLVEMHGGALVTRSAGPSKGSTFEITLPQT